MVQVVPEAEALDPIVTLPCLVPRPPVLPDGVCHEKTAEHQPVAPDVVLDLEELREGYSGGRIKLDPQDRAGDAEEENRKAGKGDRL